MTFFKKGNKRTQTKRAKSNRKGKQPSKLARFQRWWNRAGTTARSFIFVMLFGAIGVGALLYTYAIDTKPRLPEGKDEIVLSYSIGMPHTLFEEDFPTGMPPEMLLYANGLMLCGDGHETDEPLSMRQRTLSKAELQEIFNAVIAKGIYNISDQEQPEDSLDPIGTGRFIQLNTTKGAVMASAYPDNLLSLSNEFKAIEKYLQAECAKATEAFDPDDIVVEAITLSKDETKGRAKNLPNGVPVDGTPKKAKTRKVSGEEAKDLKKQLDRKGGLYKTDKGETIKARYLPIVPEYKVPARMEESTKGKVSAATTNNTRWLYVVANDQATPGNASSVINEHASNVRNYYRGQVGKYMTNAQVTVVRSSKTAAQLRACPSGKDCKGHVTLAIYYNLITEYKKAGYNTAILHSVPGSNAQGCVGWGVNSAGYNMATSSSYGFAVTTLVGCYWSEGSHVNIAHEVGHGFSLAHTCDTTLMGSCGYTKPVWPNRVLNTSQAAYLRDKNPFFNDLPSTTTTTTTTEQPTKQKGNSRKNR